MRFQTSIAPFAILLTASLPAQWAQVTPVVEPSARGDVAMCDLPQAGGVLLFGGDTRVFPNNQSAETWGYDGTIWTNLAPATIPPAAGGARLAHDVFRGVAVMFGGLGNSPFNPPAYNQTWEFDGVDWTNVTPAAPLPSPQARHNHAMAFDLARNVTVIFGGEPGGLLLGGFADTWEFDGTTGTWTLFAATSAPGRRTKHAMCYALSAAGCVMFGGFDPLAPGGNFSDDTWVFDGATWSVANVTGARPSVRYGASMVYDPVRAVCVMSGGFDDANPPVPLDETWEFDPVTNTWTQLLSSYGAGRRSPGMAFDAARATTVLSGGLGGPSPLTAVAGTWELGTDSLAFGQGCLGTNGVPTLDATAAPTLGQLYTLEMTNMPTNIPPGTGIGLLAFSNAKLPSPLDLGLVLGMTGCVAYLPADTLETVVGTNGDASWSVLVPNVPALLGGTLLSQLYTYDPGVNAFGFVNSNAHFGKVGN